MLNIVLQFILDLSNYWFLSSLEILLLHTCSGVVRAKKFQNVLDILIELRDAFQKNHNMVVKDGLHSIFLTLDTTR